MPPTERKGRVHTSTVTVAIISAEDQHAEKYLKRSPSDFKTEWFSGTGCGGQNKNKVQNSCRMIHIPTGITKSSQTRDRTNSHNNAMRELLKELDCQMHNDNHNIKANERKEQVGSGMRGDKIRTYRFQDNITMDHRNGKRSQTTKIMNGYFECLW